jgi:hypothetical protein
MIFYLNLLISFLLSFNIFTYILLVLFLSFFAAFNSNIEDFSTYKEIFQSVPTFNIFLNNPDILNDLYGERGYLILNIIIKDFITDDYIFFRAIVFLLSFSLLFYTFIKTSYFLPITIVYFIAYYFHQDTIVLRSTLATSFIMLSYIFLSQNKVIFSLLSLVIATQFQVIAYLGLIVLLLYKYLTLNRKILLFIIFLSLVVGLYGAGLIFADLINILYPESYLAEKVHWYLDIYDNEQVGILRGTVILNFFFLLYFTIKIDDFKKYFYFKVFYLSYLISFIFLVIFNDFPIVGDRAFNVYSITLPVLISYILTKVEEGSKYVFAIFILLFILLLFFKELGGYDEYNFIF